MADGRITLTDVFLGLDKHDLINTISDEAWTFLTGLLLYANTKGFKNPIDLAVKQAMSAGGGNNRQSVNRRRKALKKIKIDGKPIVKITAGKPGQNVVALYDFDYNLICSYNGVWSSQNGAASQKYDGSRDGSVTLSGRKADASRDHPKIRSEEKREENPPNPPKDVTTSIEPENENEEGGIAPLDLEDRTITKVKHIRNLIYTKYKNQIQHAPDIGKVKDALREFNGDHRPLVMAITKAANNLNTATPAAALNLVLTIARRESGGDNGGVSQEQFTTREQEIEEYEAGLKRATEAGDKEAISQLSYLLEQKKESLARLQGNS